MGATFTSMASTTSILAFGRIQWSAEDLKMFLECLPAYRQLTELSLVGNKLGSIGAEALAKALKTSSTLTKVNIGENEVGDEGATAIAELFKSNSTLTHFIF